MGVLNILEVYITGNCTLYIDPVDAILSTVRMQWTLEEFYADGGTTAFADRLAGALGIHAANIKIVSVYKGSVVVDYQIFDAIGELSKGGDIEKVKAKLVGMIVNKTLSLGAPILNADVSTNTATNSFKAPTTGSSSGSG